MKLRAAVMAGSLKRVRQALAGGGAAVPPNPNALFKDGSTPLTQACLVGCKINKNDAAGIVRLLMEAGADPALAEGSAGFTPLHVAASCNATSLVDVLVQAAPATLNHYANRGQTPLCVACGVRRATDSIHIYHLTAAVADLSPPPPANPPRLPRGANVSRPGALFGAS